MNKQGSVRKSIIVSTSFGIALLAVLLFVVWQGFAVTKRSLDTEHESVEPALLAMLEARFNVVQIQQFLTDVSATADRDGFQNAKENLDKAHRNVDTVAKLLPEVGSDATEVGRLIDVMYATGVRMAEAYISGGRAAGNAVMKEPGTGLDASAEALTSRIEKMEAQVRARMEENAAASDAYMTSAIWTGVGIGVAAALLSLVSGILLYRNLLRMLGCEPREAMAVAQRIASGDLTSEVATRKSDVTSLLYSLKVMQSSLRTSIEADRLHAAESLRIRNALDKASTNMMVADTEGRIIYMNEAVARMLRAAEADIRKELPNFHAEGLMGRNFDEFHKNPAHQRGLLGSLNAVHTAQIQVGGRTFRLVANPVMNEKGERLGSVVEWADRTGEVQAEGELAGLLDAVVQGDFSHRLNLEGKSGFFRQLAEGMNRLVEIVASGLKDVTEVMGSIARGDLTATMKGEYQGTFGQLKNDTNATVERLKEVVGRIKEATDAINTAAGEIAAGNADLSSRTEEQASSLEETASSMEELNATVRQNAQGAKRASEVAGSSSEIATRGGEMVRGVVETMGEIQTASKKIADIVGVIDSIAFQTNILALNAAVEAARAGEQGRGFAVVASEVRNLAQRSAQAAKEIKGLIADSVEQIDRGAARVHEAGTTIDEVVTSFQSVTQLVVEIAGATREQSSGIEQVTQAVAQMDEVTQQNAALVEEAAAAAESLEEQAKALADAVAMFRLDQTAAVHAPASQPAATAKVTPLPQKKAKPGAALPKVKKPAGKPATAHAVDEEWEEF